MRLFISYSIDQDNFIVSINEDTCAVGDTNYIKFKHQRQAKAMFINAIERIDKKYFELNDRKLWGDSQYVEFTPKEDVFLTLIKNIVG